MDIADHIPSKYTSIRQHQPWINHSIKQLSHRKQRHYNKARLTGLGWLRTGKHKKLKRYNQRQCKEAYDSYVNSIVSPESSNNPKRFWLFIKSKRTDYCGVGALQHNGCTYSNNYTKCNILNQYFVSVFTVDDSPNTPMSSTSLFPDIPAISVTLKGVIKLLQNLKPYKASGPDKIPTCLLKECAKEIAPSLILLFQASLKQSIVPTEWKHAFVTPIFKKGDHSLASNYRPVSLTSVCGKLLEHIVYSEVMNHLNLHDILSQSNAQHGFCSKRSCGTQLLLTVHDFASGLNDGKQTDAIILDFTKAFDKVSHKHLCTKLHYYGIRGPILDWIKDFISNRSQQVILHSCSSISLPVTLGVPQGIVLGPLLFLCFVNDIPDCISSNIRLYAGDSLLYRTINVMDNCVKL